MFERPSGYMFERPSGYVPERPSGYTLERLCGCARTPPARLYVRSLVWLRAYAFAQLCVPA